MSHSELYNIASKAIYIEWAILAIIGVKEFIRLIKTVGFRLLFQYHSLHQIQNPLHQKAIRRWKHAALSLFLIGAISIILVFALGISRPT
jgi:hypothetical protein